MLSCSICPSRGHGLCSCPAPVQPPWQGVCGEPVRRLVALALLFNLRVCGGFSFGLGVPVWKTGS